MAEDEIVELFWRSGQIVRRSQTQRPNSDKPTPHPILRGSGSGGGGGGFEEENAPLLEQPSHQNLFIREDEMASWLHHPHFYSDLPYSGAVVSTNPLSSVSQAPPPPPLLTPPYDRPPERPAAGRRAENFSMLRANILAGAAGRVESGTGSWIPVAAAAATEPTQVGSSVTPSWSSVNESCITPETQGNFQSRSATATGGGVSQTFGFGRKEKAVEIVGPSSSSGVCKAETETIQIQIQPPPEIADDRKRKEREETTEGTEEASASTARKRSRATEMHNISERRRREKINEKMKTLQELIPRCNKTDKASMLEDAIEYVKSLQMQIKMMSMGGGGMMPMMHPANMQQLMSHMAMGMNRPPFIPFQGSVYPRSGHISPSYPPPRYPFPNIQAFDTSGVRLPSQQPDPALNQTPFPGNLNPYSQFVNPQQMQQPPPSQSQTTSQVSFSQASSSKEPEDQGNKLTG